MLLSNYAAVNKKRICAACSLTHLVEDLFQLQKFTISEADLHKKPTENQLVLFGLDWGSGYCHVFKYLGFHQGGFLLELCSSGQIIGQVLFILTSLDKIFIIIIMLIFVMWIHFMLFFFPISSTSSITPQFLANLNAKLSLLFRLPKMIIRH